MNPHTKQLIGTFTNTQGGQFALNLFARVSETPKFIYFGCPFTVPPEFQAILTKTLKDNPALNKFHMLPPFNFGYDIFCDALEDQHFQKFAFARDPIDRFCETYHKVLAPEAANSDQKEKLFEFLDLPEGAELSLNDLAKLFATSDLDRDAVPICRPQRKLIAYDIVDFDFVGDGDNWQADLMHFIKDHLNLPVAEGSIQAATPTQVPEKIFDIDTQTQQYIEKAYVTDFEMIEEIGDIQF